MHRILLAVSGLSPQILTETLYALAVSAEEKWVPHEIHLITTLRGKEHAALNLLSGMGWYHQLCRDYDLPPMAFDEEHIHLIKNRNGQPLEDIRTPEDNEAAADSITELIRRLTQNPESEVHVSIAGGRKTMGFFAGYALSLFGRDQDRLSHVLVSSPYEAHHEFFYPTPYERVIHTYGEDKRTVDCRHAKVWLADIPFVRLRDGLQAPLLSGNASFSEAVSAVSRPVPVSVTLDPENRTVTFGDRAVKLNPVLFILYAWMARRNKEGLPALCFDQRDEKGLDAVALMAELRRIDPDLLGKLQPIERAISKGVTKEWFAPNRTRLNSKLKQALGERAADPYLIKTLSDQNSRKSGQSLYALQLSTESINLGG